MTQQNWPADSAPIKHETTVERNHLVRKPKQSVVDHLIWTHQRMRGQERDTESEKLSMGKKNKE